MSPPASARRSIGVSIMPGGMTLTVIPCVRELERERLASGRSRRPSRRRSAPCAAHPTARSTTRSSRSGPNAPASMSGTAACRQWNVPVRLTARTRSQLSIVMSVKRSNASRPALVTMIAMGPSSARTLSSAASTAAAVGDVGLHADRGGSRLAQLLGGPQRRLALQVEQRRRGRPAPPGAGRSPAPFPTPLR